MNKKHIAYKARTTFININIFRYLLFCVVCNKPIQYNVVQNLGNNKDCLKIVKILTNKLTNMKQYTTVEDANKFKINF